MSKKYLNIGMYADYNNKKKCFEKAKEIIENKQITGMTVKQLAAEIYTHGFIYYRFDKLPKFIKYTSLAKRFYNSCDNGVDLEDDGDRWYRKFAYRMIYIFL